jgi:predicted esterase
VKTNHAAIDGVEVAWRAPDGEEPRPLVMLLATSARETLDHETFGEIGAILGAEGWVVAALDLPCHGTAAWPTTAQGLTGWAELDPEEMLVSWTERLSGALGHLIAARVALPNRIALAGTSRGGFMALQAAARLPDIAAVVAFAPVTDLTVLTEFAAVRDRPGVAAAALIHRVEALADRPIWMRIGDADDRVSTAHARAFADAVKQHAATPRIHFETVSRPGHTTGPGWHADAARWLLARFSERP